MFTINKKLLSTDMIRSKGFITLVDQGVFSIANFATSIVIGRLCSKEQFGLYLLGMTIINFAMDVQGSFITTPYTIFIPRYKGVKRALYTGSAALHQFVFSGFVILALGIVALFVPEEFLPKDFKPILYALVLVSLFLLLRDFGRRLSFATLQMTEALALDFTVSILQISGLLILAYLDAMTPARAFLVIGSSCAVFSVVWFYKKRAGISIKFQNIWHDFKRNILSGKWIFASGLLWSGSAYLYPWILTKFHGTEATGIWAACHGVLALCNPLFLGMQNYFTPKIAHSYAENGRAGLRSYSVKSTLIIGLAISLCSVVLVVLGEFLLSTMYGDKYSGNGLIVSILAVDLIFIALGFSLSRAFFAIEKAKIDFRINFVSLAILIIAGTWLIKVYGPLGAALGLLIGNFLAIIIRGIVFNKILGKKTNPVPINEHSFAENK